MKDFLFLKIKRLPGSVNKKPCLAMSRLHLASSNESMLTSWEVNKNQWLYVFAITYKKINEKFAFKKEKERIISSFSIVVTVWVGLFGFLPGW